MMTKNGATTVIYVDGVDVTTAGTNATLADTVQILRVGFQAAASQRFVGTLDELAIYRDVLGAWCANDHWERRLSAAFMVH